MKILYDHQIFSSQKYGGVSRYFYELIKKINIKNNVSILSPIIFSNNYYISDKKDVEHIRFLPNNNFKGKQKIILMVNKINMIINLMRQKYDIFHPTNYDSYFLSYISTKPFVITIHDMIHEKFADMYSIDNKTTKHKRILCEKASKIIAISNNTKKDLIELFSIEESKIEVIYHGNSLVLSNDHEFKIKLPEKYILFVGSRNKYKNFTLFIKSVSLLLNEDLNLYVVCVGGGSFNNEELILFEELKIKNRIIQFDLEDNLLSQFYFRALMFIFPSLYEGFGMPILEAFSCECPLVCSNISSFPEIAVDGAIYFDPYDKESMYKAMKKVYNSENDRHRIIRNGKERLKYFSWEKTAEKTKKIYESIIEEKI